MACLARRSHSHGHDEMVACMDVLDSIDTLATGSLDATVRAPCCRRTPIV